MNGEKSKDVENKTKAKLKEMQKHMPFLQEFLNSLSNGENNVARYKKVKMVIEIIMGKIPCTKLDTLMRLEEVITKIKENKQRIVQEMAKILKKSKSSKYNASEVIDLDSSDDDDVEVVSCTALGPETIISSPENEKCSPCVVLTEPEKETLTFPDKLEIQKMKEKEICTTANKVVASDTNKNSESVPDLIIEAEKRDESLGITLKNQISSNSQNKKIKMNLIIKESLTSVTPKSCDYVNKEVISPSVSIPNKNNSTELTKNIPNVSKIMAEVSSTTRQVKEKTPKLIECNKSSTIADSEFTEDAKKASQKNKTKPNETKEILKLSLIDFEDISSEEENLRFSSPEISPNIKTLLDVESNKNLINEEDVEVTTTKDNQDSPLKHSNLLKSIDLPEKDENDMGNIQDLDLFSKVDIYFDDVCSSEAEIMNEDVVSSTSHLTVFEVSEHGEKSKAEVSSSCNECDPQVNERSLQTSPISLDPLSPMLSSKISRSSTDTKENEDVENTPLLTQGIITSSQESSVLDINDAETEQFIKRLNLAIGVETPSKEKINDEKALTKDTSESIKCQIPFRRLSNAQFSIRCSVPRLTSEVFKPSTPKLRISSPKDRAYSTSSTQRSQRKIYSRRPSQVHSLDATGIKGVKLKNQIQALKLTMPLTSKGGPNSPLQERLINGGFLSERRNSLKQTGQISCVTITEVLKNSKESESTQSAMKDNSSEKISNNLECNSNEKRALLPEEASISPKRMSLSEKCSEKDNTQLQSVEKVLGSSSSPLKDSPNEEEFFNKSMHIEHKETLKSDALNKYNDLNFKPNETISEREKQNLENNRLKNLEVEADATPKKVQRKAHQVKSTPEKEKWKTQHTSHQFKPDKLKTLKIAKERRNTIHVETEPRKSSSVESGTAETLKVRRDSRKTIHKVVEPSLETEIATKKAAIETDRAHQLELASERKKQENLRSVKKERRKTLKKIRRTSVAETSHKKIEKALEAETTKNKVNVEAANKALKEKKSKIKKEKHKIKELEVETANRKNELKLTQKKSSQNTPEGEKSNHTISNIEDIEIKIATRKRRKPILESSSDNESKGTHYHSDEEEKKIARRKKKISVLSSSSENEADTEKSLKISMPNCKEICSNINNSVSSETSKLKEFQEQNVLKLDISNTNEIKEFACRLVKPLLREKSFEKFQSILENSKPKIKKRKSVSPTDGRISKQFKVSPRELKALNKDLEETYFGDAVRKVTGRRKSSVNCLNVLTAMKNAENSQNSEEEERLEKNKSNLNDEDYDTDNFDEHVSRKKEEEQLHRIINNPPVVLVAKILPEDLKKSTKPAETGNLAEHTTTSKSKLDEHLLKPLRSIQIKNHTERRKSQCAKPKSKETKNTNPIWHYKDSLFSTSCILCSHKSSQLVEHYLESHPHDEVYISRLPSADVRDLEENPGRATRHLTKPHQYIAECFFCGQTIKGRFDKLSHHYATHTGEIPYECSACTFMSCSKSEMVKHTKAECKKDARLQVYYTYDKNVTKINLYLCTKCNYMQLHEANIIRHIQKQHDCNDIHERDVTTLTLLELVDDPQQNILIVNEPVPSDTKSDEKIVIEDQPEGTLVLPIMLENEVYDTASVISSASIDVKPETILIDPCPGQSNEGMDRNGTLSTVLKLENPELPKTTTHEDNVMTVKHDWESEYNNFSNEDKNINDDIEEILRILTCTPPSDSLRSTDQHNATYDPNSLAPANESQKVIEVNIGRDLTTSNLPTKCQLQGEVDVENENNHIGSFTTKDQEKSRDVEIQEKSITVIEILDDEDEKPIDFLKKENMLEEVLRVEHCGYQETRDSEYIFHCLFERCNFGVTVSFEILQDHFKKEHDVMWSGKCDVCKDKLKAIKQPVEEELNHMISVHIKEFQDSQSTDGHHVINLLKPWLNNTKSYKKKILCEGMVSEALLKNLYKCMGNDCCFTSDSKEQMSKHLATHELRTIGKVDNQRPWLECCYCDHYADKPLLILEHVHRRHSSSIFQCSRCFYRSCSRINVKNHQNQYHTSNVGKNSILECSGNIKTVTDDFKRIQKLKEDNIKAVSCSVCTQKYIRKDLMTEHFKMVHENSEIPTDVRMGLFSCIFCNFENDDVVKMCCHMANNHPEELLLIGVRGIKENTVEHDISSIAAPEITKWVNIETQPNDNSSSAGLAETQYQSGTNDLQKFKESLMNLQDLQNLYNPCSTDNNSHEEENSEVNERALTELSTKMVNSLKYFIKSEILHPCCICSKEINLENQWTDHFNKAHPTISRDAFLQCPECPKMSSFWTYPLHFINHHTDQHKIYFCYYCADHFYNFAAADKHLMSHTGKEEQSKCKYFKLSQKSDADDDKIKKIGIVMPATNTCSVVEVIKHMIEISKKRKEEQSKSTNVIDVTIDLNKNICDVNYPAYIPEKRRYVCTSCNNKWMDEKAFENHFKTVHKTILSNDKFKCPHCDLFISSSNYEVVHDHLRLHSQEIIYKCYLCNMYTDNIELLIKHIKNYKQQSVPIARFTRDGKIEKYVYNVVHFSPLSTKGSSEKTIQCFFCSSQVDTYKNLDIHLSNVHSLGRTYKCYYCTYQGDIKNVNSHIKETHVKSDPKKCRFISMTVFLTIQSQEENCSHHSYDQKVESSNNASCSKAVEEAQDVSRKRKYDDISDRPASDQNSEVENRLKSENLEAEKSENCDRTVEDGTTGNYHVCNFCAFKCSNYEDHMTHIETHFEHCLNSIHTSAESIQTHNTQPVIQGSLPNSSNISLERRQETQEDNIRLVPINELLQPTSTNQNNTPQSTTHKKPNNNQSVNFFTYKCFHCDTEFNSYDILCGHWHFSTCPSRENKSYRFRIARTEQNFISRYMVDKIIRNATLKSQYYQCLECGNNFFDKDFCIQHMAAKLLAPLYYFYEQNDIFYGCDECKVFYNTEELAIQHIAKHTFRFSCLFCPNGYRRLEELHLHYFHTHNIEERRYKYDIRSSRNMNIYNQMLVAFPCGLIISKYDLRRTCWGNEKAFTKLIVNSTKEDIYQPNSWNFY